MRSLHGVSRTRMVIPFVRDDDGNDCHRSHIDSDMCLYPALAKTPLVPKPFTSFGDLDAGRIDGQHMRFVTRRDDKFCPLIHETFPRRGEVRRFEVER